MYHLWSTRVRLISSGEKLQTHIKNIEQNGHIQFGHTSQEKLVWHQVGTKEYPHFIELWKRGLVNKGLMINPHVYIQPVIIWKLSSPELSQYTCNYFCLQDVFWLCFVIPFELSEIFQLVYLSLDKTRRFFPSVLFHNYLMYKINFVFYLPFKKKKYSQAS